MAYIRFSGETEIVYLREYHRIGRRAEAVDTRLDYPFVSKLHAVIEWKEPNWLIRDLSQNGIWVNGDRLAAQVRHVLNVNDHVEIAGNQGIHFRVSNLEKPENMIFNSAQTLERISIEDGVILPDETNPKLGLYKCPDRLQWFTEELQKQGEYTQEPIDELHPYEMGPYDHGDAVQCEETVWRLFLVGEDDITTEFQSEQPSIADVEFRFDISQNEENTSLTLLHGHDEIDLGERSHHYLLAYLLRQKNAQIEAEQATLGTNDAAGWMDCQLVETELGIEESHLNIQIFRARKQILNKLVGFTGSSKLIERRRGAVRMGINNYSIYKEGVRES